MSDASGAAIPSVNLKVVNQDSGAALNVATNHEGIYTATALLPGVNRIEARACESRFFRAEQRTS